MEETREVISAFLDGEAFDPDDLMAALTDPAGRELLVDLAALRRIVQPSSRQLPQGIHFAARSDARAWTSRSLLRWSGAAAALVVSLLGGYVLGARREPVATELQAPPATRVVQAVEIGGRSIGGPR